MCLRRRNASALHQRIGFGQALDRAHIQPQPRVAAARHAAFIHGFAQQRRKFGGLMPRRVAEQRGLIHAHTDFFDNTAKEWDTKHQRVAQAKAIAQIIEQTIPLTRATKALEFGCGTGLLGFNLIEKVGEMTFSDTSRGMLSEVENKLKISAYTSAKIVDLNVAKIVDSYDLIFLRWCCTTLQIISKLLLILANHYILKAISASVI